MYDLNGFIITDSENGLRWMMRMSGDVVMSGQCTLMPDVLVMHTYDDISTKTVDEPQQLWDRTRYYMTVSDSGVTHVYRAEDGEEAPDEIKKEIGAQIGCTLRFR